MANILKTKVAISGVSVLIIVLVPLLKSNFMKPVVMKRWSQLTWEDFQGIAKPWSKYDAGIYSEIFLEYDSGLKRYRAYAAQNNIQSWVKRGYEPKSTDYLLTHEQYHFNITEYMARTVDKSIVENIEDEEYLHLMRVRNGNGDLSKMQNSYDLETAHGTRLHRQRRWEFRIDSLLSGDEGWLTDIYSGATIFLPNRGESSLEKWITDYDARERKYSIDAYGMSFSLASIQYAGGYDDSVIFKLIKNSKNRSSAKLLRLDSSTHPSRADLFSKDSTGERRYFSWIHNGPRLYNIFASFRGVSGDTTGYYEIARSVINSFKINDVDSAWARVTESTVVNTSSVGKKKLVDDVQTSCLVRGGSGPIGFVTNTIFFEDGGAQFSCDFSDAADSIRYEDFLLLNHQDYLSYKPRKEGQTFYINPKLMKNLNFVEIGYILKEDTSKKCFRSFNEIIPLRVIK